LTLKSFRKISEVDGKRGRPVVPGWGKKVWELEEKGTTMTKGVWEQLQPGDSPAGKVVRGEMGRPNWERTNLTGGSERNAKSKGTHKTSTKG